MTGRFGLVAVLASAVAPTALAGDPADFLTRDGRLKDVLTFRKGTTGLAVVGTPKGEAWTVQPSGEWTSQVAGGKGKLTARQLAALAQHLATQDFDTLPVDQGYKSPAIDEVYQTVTIGFGKKRATFNFKVGESPTDYVPAPGDPHAAGWSRFVALELALTDLLGPAGAKEK